MEKIKLYVCPVCSNMHKYYDDADDCCPKDIETELGYACSTCDCGYSDKESAKRCCESTLKQEDKEDES